MLYGRDAVFKDIVPALVGLRLDKERRLRDPAGTPPVVEFAGGRLTGRTALLEELEERYAKHLPQAYADLAQEDFGQPGLAPPYDPGPANVSRTADLLFLLRHELGRRPKKFDGTLAFPRLTLGLLAVTSWQEALDGETEAARHRLAGLLLASEADDAVRRSRAAQWIKQLPRPADAVPGATAEVDPRVAALADVVGTELLGHGATTTGRNWWADRPIRPHGGAHSQLTALRLRFRSTPTDQRFAERQLLAALLADIAGHYTLRRRLNWLPRPLLLLDNAHTPLGRQVLDGLTWVWHEGTTRHRPGVVVTTLAEEPATLDPERAALSTRTATGPFWLQTRPETADGWLLRVPLAQLSPDEVQGMFEDTPVEPGTARLIQRLAAGRAGIAHTLVQAARQEIRQRGFVPDHALLDLASAADPDQSVRERLLRTLFPEELARTRLVRFAPALDEQAALALGGVHPPGGDPRLAVQDTVNLLADGRWGPRHWPGAAESPFIGDPVLRTLLLHESLARTSATPEAVGWKDLQLALRGVYGRDTEPNRTMRLLHHSLSLGHTAVVARVLHQYLAGLTSPRRAATAGQGASWWLGALNLICAAPPPPANMPLPASRPVPCPACPGGKRDSVHRAVELLLLGLWKQSQPLTPPDPNGIGDIERQLLTLAPFGAPAAKQVFELAHREWPRLLSHWIQAPYLPTWGETRP
ncbi:hypothetical protein [Kitasatospora sp. NPDC093806]|uniref:hypothetical protein n=1 Tax=Kitasatospora sp. NPDC093806 TaxID=3155075 RepID=UPI0034198A5B